MDKVSVISEIRAIQEKRGLFTNTIGKVACKISSINPIQRANSFERKCLRKQSL